jgi:hypothetical protein
MSPRKSFSNKIVEVKPIRVESLSNRASAEGMEWTVMNKDDANESLLSLIGELLYKNQLLREAIASKDEAIELIVNHLMCASTSACSCGVANQLTFVRNMVKEQDVAFECRKRYCFNEFCNIGKYLIDRGANSNRTRRSELQKNRG